MVMKSQARRNLQKVLSYIPLDADVFSFGTWIAWLKDRSPFQNEFGKPKTPLPEMIRTIARTIADEDQTELEKTAAIADGDVPTSAAIQTYAGVAPSNREVDRAIKLTLDDLKQLSFEKIHTGTSPKSLDWALENEKIDATDSPSLHSKFRAYCRALEALAKPSRSGNSGKGSGKAGKAGKPPAPVLDAFRKHCESLGVKFSADRHGDISTLLAAVKVRATEVY